MLFALCILVAIMSMGLFFCGIALYLDNKVDSIGPFVLALAFGVGMLVVARKAELYEEARYGSVKTFQCPKPCCK
jgi:hypothetical protein